MTLQAILYFANRNSCVDMRMLLHEQTDHRLRHKSQHIICKSRQSPKTGVQKTADTGNKHTQPQPRSEYSSKPNLITLLYYYSYHSTHSPSFDIYHQDKCSCGFSSSNSNTHLSYALITFVSPYLSYLLCLLPYDICTCPCRKNFGRYFSISVRNTRNP